jgi:hypothetical protein
MLRPDYDLDMKKAAAAFATFCLLASGLPNVASGDDAILVQRSVQPQLPDEASEDQFVSEENQERVSKVRPILSKLAPDLGNVEMNVLLPIKQVPENMSAWYADSHSYLAEFELSAGVSLEVFGTAVASIVPKDAQYVAKSRYEEIGYNLSQTEDGIELGFVAFGHGYSLRVTCSDNFEDQHCQAPDFVESVMEDLAVVK